MFWYSKEPSYREGSFEYPQHMFRLRNKKNIFQLHTLIWGPAHYQASTDFCHLLITFANSLDPDQDLQNALLHVFGILYYRVCLLWVFITR